MAATDARPVARKNQAFRIYFGLRSGDGTPVINWTTPSGFISKDGAAFANTTSTPTEITPKNTGAGYLDLSATEMNCDGVVLKIATSNASMIPLLLTLYPEQSGDYRIDANVVADQVWDEVLSTHTTTGSAGRALALASGTLVALTATSRNAVADQVWDEVLSGHATTGSAGRALALASGTLVALTATSRNLVADQVWNETLSDHDTPGSTGHALVVASGNLIGSTTLSAADVWGYTSRSLTQIGPAAVSGDIAGAIWNAALADYGGAGTTAWYLSETWNNTDLTYSIVNSNLDATVSSRSSHSAANVWTSANRSLTNLGPAAASGDVEAAVWKATLSKYPTTGTAGRALALSSGTLVALTSNSRNLVADQVWDEILSTHTVAGSAGRALALASGTLVALTSTSRNLVADQVWDEILSGHTTTGSTARALASASGSLSAANVWTYNKRTLTGLGPAATSGDVTAAIWNATMSSYDTPGTTGHALVTASGNLIGGATAQQVWEYSARSITNLGSAAVSGDIAGAVWDEILADHISAGSTGQALVTASGNLLGVVSSTGLATTTQLEYWALMILNNCGGGPVG